MGEDEENEKNETVGNCWKKKKDEEEETHLVAKILGLLAKLHVI